MFSTECLTLLFFECIFEGVQMCVGLSALLLAHFTKNPEVYSWTKWLLKLSVDSKFIFEQCSNNWRKLRVARGTISIISQKSIHCRAPIETGSWKIPPNPMEKRIINWFCYECIPADVKIIKLVRCQRHTDKISARLLQWLSLFGKPHKASHCISCDFPEQSMYCIFVMPQ